MSVDNYDIDNMIEVINNWGEINRQKDLEIQKLKEANSGSVINLRLKILKEENEKLNEHNLELNNECQLLQEENGNFSDLVHDIHQRELEKESLQKEIEKLKEENEKLMDEIEYRKSTTDSEIAELNGEIKLLKDILKGYEKKEEEWLPLSGVNGIMNDLFYGGYHTSKVIGGDPEEVIQGVKELKEQIDKLKKPKKTITCSNCGQIGHNKRYCHNIGNTIKNITGQNQ